MLKVRLQCYPHNRNWSAGEKCEPCKLGGQGCGPDVRHPRNGGAGAHVLEPAPLLPRIPKSDLHQTSPNSGADQDLLFTNRVPTAEGSSATRSQSQEANPTRVTEIPFPSSQNGEHVSELERLSDLHDRGALTDEEFAAEKAELLHTS